MDALDASPSLSYQSEHGSALIGGGTSVPFFEHLDHEACTSITEKSRKRGSQELYTLPEQGRQKKTCIGILSDHQESTANGSKTTRRMTQSKNSSSSRQGMENRGTKMAPHAEGAPTQVHHTHLCTISSEAGKQKQTTSTSLKQLPNSWKDAEKCGVKLFAAQELQEAAMGVKVGFAPLSAMQATVLQHVARARWKGISQADLAQALGTQPRNFFQVAKGLESRGMIVRQGFLGSASTPVVVFLSRFAPSQAMLTPPNSIVQPDIRVVECLPLTNVEEKKSLMGCNAQQDEACTAFDEDSIDASLKVQLKRDPPDCGAAPSWEDEELLRMAMDFIRNSPGEVALERSIKIHLNLHEGTTSHRRWRRLRNRLLKGGIVEQVGIEKKKGTHACLKLTSSTKCSTGNGAHLLPSSTAYVDSDHVSSSLAKRCTDAIKVNSNSGSSKKDCSAAGPCVLAEAPLDRQIISFVQESLGEGVTYNMLFSYLGLPVKQNLHMIESLDKAKILDSSLESFGKHARYRLYLQSVWKDTHVILRNCSWQGTRNVDILQSRCDGITNEQAEGRVNATMSINCSETNDHPLWGLLGSTAIRFLPLLDEIQWSAGPDFHTFCTALMDLLPYHNTLPPIQATPRMRVRHGLLLAHARNMRFLLQVETGRLIRIWEDTNTAIDLKTARRLISSLLSSNLVRMVTFTIGKPEVLKLQDRKIIRALVPSSLDDRDIDWDRISEHMLELEKCREGSAKLPLLDPSQCQHLLEMSKRTSRIMLDNHRSLLCSGFAWAKAIRARELHVWLIDWLDGRADGDCFASSELHTAMDMEIFCLTIGTRDNLLRIQNMTSKMPVPLKLWTSQASKRLTVLLKLLGQVGVLESHFSSVPKPEPSHSAGGTQNPSIQQQLNLCEEKLKLVADISLGPLNNMEVSDTWESFFIKKKEGALSFWKRMKEILVNKEESRAGSGWLARMPHSLRNPANWSEIRLISFEKRVRLLKWLSENVIWRIEELQKQSIWEAYINHAIEVGLTGDQARLILFDYAPTQFQDLLSLIFPRPARRSHGNKARPQLAGHIRVGGLSLKSKGTVAKGGRSMNSAKCKGKKESIHSHRKETHQHRNHDLPIIRNWTVEDDKSLLEAYVRQRARTLGEGAIDWRAIPGLPTRVSLCKRRIAHFKSDHSCWKLVNAMILHLRHSRTEHFQECLNELLYLTKRFRYSPVSPSNEGILSLDTINKDPLTACLANKLVGRLLQQGETELSLLLSDRSLTDEYSIVQLQRALGILEFFGVCRQSGTQSNRILKLSHKFWRTMGDSNEGRAIIDSLIPNAHGRLHGEESSAFNAQQLAYSVERLAFGLDDDWEELVLACQSSSSHPEEWMTLSKNPRPMQDQVISSQQFCNALHCSEKLIPCNENDLFDFLSCVYTSKQKLERPQAVNPSLARSASGALMQKIHVVEGISMEKATEALEIFVEEPLLFLEVMSLSGMIRLVNTFHRRRVFVQDSTSAKCIVLGSVTEEILVNYNRNDFYCKQYFEYEYRPWQSSDCTQQKRMLEKLIKSMLWTIYTNPGMSQDDFLKEFQTIGLQNAYDVLSFLLSDGLVQVLDPSGLSTLTPANLSITSRKHFLSSISVTIA